MAKRLTEDQRGRLAEKIMEWGNLAFVGLVIAQIIPPVGFSLRVTVVGILAIAGAYLIAISIMKGGGS